MNNSISDQFRRQAAFVKVESLGSGARCGLAHERAGHHVEALGGLGHGSPLVAGEADRVRVCPDSHRF
ncbi:MAG: hypothetical protein OXF11_10485, partial [Deltaproteobacteria bacterium]|nr:hypothetical protein [Deltaproteobacteria bacterium]